MKRFYKTVAVAPVGAGFALLLDGRGVKTPARNALEVSTRALADAIAQEWRTQGETIDPRAMPLTGLVNAAIDRVAPDSGTFAAGLARFAEGDLLCYRAGGPAALVARQAAAWEPLLDWARRRYDVEFRVTSGILHTPQPEETVKRLAKAVAARGPFALAGLAPLVTVSGSLVIALAVAEEAFTVDEAWRAAAVDDGWQTEKWGTDAEAEVALVYRRRDFEAGARFLALLG